MAFYDDLLISSGSRGIVTFDAEVLDDLPGSASWEHRQDIQEPKGIRARLTAPGNLLSNILVHRSGRQAPDGLPGTDLSLDTLVLTVAEMATLPPPFQARFYDYEQHPGITGRRPGVTRPPRANN